MAVTSRHNKYSSIPDWFGSTDTQQTQPAVQQTAPTVFASGSIVTGSSGLQTSINLYNKFVVEYTDVTSDILTISDTVIVAVAIEGDTSEDKVLIGTLLSVPGWKTSDFVSIAANTTLTVTASSHNNYGIVFYDNTQTPINGSVVTEVSQQIIVPENASYFRICSETGQQFALNYAYTLPYTKEQLDTSNLNLSNYLNLNDSIPEGINKTSFDFQELSLVVQSPLAVTKDINNVVKLSLNSNSISGDYVTTDSTEQEVIGVKTFKNGINIGDHKLYQSTDDVIFLDATLLVRGGIVMYANDPSDGSGSPGSGVVTSIPWDQVTIWVNPETGLVEVKTDTLIERILESEALENKFFRKDQDDRSEYKIATDKAIEVGTFVSGASGAIIQVDKNTGQTTAELDKLYVRMKAYFETLEIINVNSIGGKMILSPAGSMTCIGVEELENTYRCYFLGEQDGEAIENRWEIGMQAYSQMFNAKEGVSNKVSNIYYWRLVTEVSEETVEYNNQKCYYIDLSKTDCDSGSDIPKAGDVINHRGARTDTDYMNFIEFSSVGINAPYITLFQGVNSYSLVGKDYVQFGYDQATGKAFMNVYGDMYVGARDESSYMRYTEEEGLEIKGKLSVGTTLGGNDLQEMINAASPEGYQEFVDKVTKDLAGLQNQIDGAIESYFYQYIPTLENYPAMEWTTDAQKEAHLNDTFTNLADGRSWRWTVAEDGTYGWTEITDTATAQALALAGKAQDTADGKRRVFTDTPYPPYDLGDLWAGGINSYLMKCVVAKSSGEYDAADWDYADNASQIKAATDKLVQNTKDELNNAIEQATEAANNYTDEAKTALQNSIDELNEAKANVDEVYSIAKADEIITQAEADAVAAAKVAADAAIALSETTVKAYADGKVSEEEKARIEEAKANLEAAKKYAEEKAQEALNDALTQIETFDYLKAALNEVTTIDGGLILTSLIKLGYTSSTNDVYYTMSGLNGIYNTTSIGGGIATWWGGDLHDLQDYYNWNGTKWVVKDDITIPTRIPSGLIRFDGTGYFANGNFWWDNSGVIHADPTALFLTFDEQIGDESIAATILGIRKDVAEFISMWQRKIDEAGNYYVYTTLPIVTQQNIVMYADNTTFNVDSIYDGLPVDGSTIYWSEVKDDKGNVIDKILKANVGTGGAITEITSEMVVDALGYTPANINSLATVATSGKYSDLTGSPTLLSSFTNDVGFITSFTDTKNTAGATNTSSKIFLIGATAQNSNPQTYSHDTAYVDTDGCLYSGGSKVLTAHQTIYNLTLQAGSFSAKTFDPNGADVTINIPTTTSHISEGSNLYFTNARAQAAITGGASTISTSNLTASRALISDASGKVAISAVTSTELGYLDGVTSAIQTQLNSKLAATSYTAADVLAKIKTVDGAGSSLDADLLDGMHAYISGNNGGVWGYIPSVKSDGVIELGRYMDFHFQSGENIDYSTRLYVDAANNNNVALPSSSGTLALLTDNVASATKLQTARTIWGHSFDGTGNIDGALTVNTRNLGVIVNNSVQNGTESYISFMLYGTLFANVGYTAGSGAHLFNNKTNKTIELCSDGNLRYGNPGSGEMVWHAGNSNISTLDWNVKSLIAWCGGTTRQVVIGRKSYTWDGDESSYPLIATTSSNSNDVYTMIATPHVPFLKSGHRGYTGYSFGSIIRFEGDITNAKIWDIGCPGSNVNAFFIKCGNSNIASWGSDGLMGIYVPNQWLSTSFLVLGRKDTTVYENAATIGVTDGNLHLDAYQNHTVYINYYSSNNVQGLIVGGGILSTGGITMYSDIRKKTKLQDVELSLSQIANAPLIEHYYTSDINKTTHVGSIAQYWAEMNDWFCKLDNEGFYTMEIQNAALASAISIARELVKYESKTDRKIRLLKQRVKELEDKIEKLENN